ncbi:MAG: sialidase family protein [Candidatus Hydrogenedentota bacterium]
MNVSPHYLLPGLLALGFLAAAPLYATPPDPLPGGIARTLVLAPGDDNPRNSEGDFVTLDDGRILFVYTHFTGGGGDHDRAVLAARVSEDGGKTWSENDRVIVADEGGMNVMSVSLLRLDTGPIALFYLRKDSTEDCRPFMRLSRDEGETWSEAHPCITDPIGYYVVNNNRVVQLDSGRLLIPAARHVLPGESWTPGKTIVWRSDDDGKTWQASNVLEPPEPIGRSGLQEPGITPLGDGRLLMLMRTDAGCQYASYSSDGGESWQEAEPTGLASPVSPASIAPVPETDNELLLVWNDHRHLEPDKRSKRTPLTVAISKDAGKTWEHVKNVEDNPDGWYCYTAIHFADAHVLLGLCAGDRSKTNGLALTEVLRIPLDWLYKPGETIAMAP